MKCETYDPIGMETEFRDADFAEQLCQLDRESERSRSASLELCDLILQSRSMSEPRREWVAASEWAPTFPEPTGI